MRALQLLRWLVALASPFLFLLLFPLADELAKPPADRRVVEVEAFASNATRPPPADANWLKKKLPLHLREVHRTKHVWYRIVLADLPFDLPAGEPGDQSDLWTLSVGAPIGSVTVYRNDQLLAALGNGEAPYTVYRHPVSVSLSPALLQPEDVLYINFRRPDTMGFVYNNYLAPHAELKPYLDNQEFLRELLPQWLLAIMCAVSVFMLALYWLRRGDREYLWWALMLLAWALREATDLAVDPWFDDPQLWIVMRALALGAFAAFGYVFIKSFLRQGRTLVDPALVISGIIWTSVLLFFASTDSLTRELNTKFWTPWVVMVSLMCCGQLARGIFKSTDRDVPALLVLCWFISVVGIYDYLFSIDPNAIADYVLRLQYSAGFALTVFTLILMRRFAGALGEVEQSNVVLEDRIQEQKQRLEKAYENEKEIEQRRLVLEERERIMQDMHDGIGGQLVQALSIVSQDPKLLPVEPALRQALDDLRLIIDSLSVPDGSLPMLLASFRHRLVRPVERAGLTFEWELSDLPADLQLSQSDLLHVLRILQESVTNVLKHSGARTLKIATDMRGDAVRIRVTDDGSGIAPAAELSLGRGLANMRKRAAKIGGELTVEPAPVNTAGNKAENGGTQVTLTVPFSRPVSPTTSAPDAA